jgi:hypothetical protein
VTGENPVSTVSRAKLIDYYLDKLSQPGFEFHQIRQELEANNVDEEEIKIIVRLVDNEVQRKLATRNASAGANQIIVTGAVISAIGALVTVGTYTGIINTGNYFIIAYGPFFAGLSILVAGLARRRS